MLHSAPGDDLLATTKLESKMSNILFDVEEADDDGLASLDPVSGFSGAQTPAPALIPRQVLEPTVEDFARLQSFEGAFNDALWLPQALWKQPTLPALPSALDALSCTADVKESIWRTLLCITYIEAKFSADRDVWEVIVEKAMEWAHEELSTGGANTDDVLASANVDAAKLIVQ